MYYLPLSQASYLGFQLSSYLDGAGLLYQMYVKRPPPLPSTKTKRDVQVSGVKAIPDTKPVQPPPLPSTKTKRDAQVSGVKAIPIVKHKHRNQIKYRQADGFSTKELENSSMYKSYYSKQQNINIARNDGIYIDERRHSMYTENVEILNQYAPPRFKLTLYNSSL
jgi:ribosomal protein L13E